MISNVRFGNKSYGQFSNELSRAYDWTQARSREDRTQSDEVGFYFDDRYGNVVSGQELQAAKDRKQSNLIIMRRLNIKD